VARKNAGASDAPIEMDPLAAGPQTQPEVAPPKEPTSTSAEPKAEALPSQPTPEAKPLAVQTPPVVADAAPAAAAEPKPAEPDKLTSLYQEALGNIVPQLMAQAERAAGDALHGLKLSDADAASARESIHALTVAGAAVLGASEPAVIQKSLELRNEALDKLRQLAGHQAHDLEQVAIVAAHKVFTHAQDLVRGNLGHEAVGILGHIVGSRLFKGVLAVAKLVA
jgi:hypothetical protein